MWSKYPKPQLVQESFLQGHKIILLAYCAEIEIFRFSKVDWNHEKFYLFIGMMDHVHIFYIYYIYVNMSYISLNIQIDINKSGCTISSGRTPPTENWTDRLDTQMSVPPPQKKNDADISYILYQDVCPLSMYYL